MITGEMASLLIWDLRTALPPRKTSPDKLTPAQLAELWTDLANMDAVVGHKAMVALVRRPDAVAYLKSRTPRSSADATAFKKRLGELDDKNFDTREAAFQALAQMGDGAGAMIREALKSPASLEAKRRLTTLAEKLTISDNDRVRWLRCIELLERIGTPAARGVLEAFRNVSDSETAADAARSLERLAGLAKQ